jgi:hypothetical protein
MTLSMELASTSCLLVAVAVNYANSMHREIKNAKEKNRVFMLIVFWGGMRLRSLGMFATIWPIVPEPDCG